MGAFQNHKCSAGIPPDALSKSLLYPKKLRLVFFFNYQISLKMKIGTKDKFKHGPCFIHDFLCLQDPQISRFIMELHLG